MCQHSFSYLVGGLLAATLTPETQQEKLNLCGELGWELVAINNQKINGYDYVMLYFKRPHTGQDVRLPRFDGQRIG
jgi:hypothetical protein